MTMTMTMANLQNTVEQQQKRIDELEAYPSSFVDEKQPNNTIVDNIPVVTVPADMVGF